jgi:GTP-binding protein
VCDLSGTTRDAVDTRLTLPSGEEVVLIDTAGMRKRAKVASGSEAAFEQLSVDRALRAVSRADVVVAVVDAAEGVTQQDFRLTELAAAHGKALVVVANKWDRADRERWPSSDAFSADVRAQLRHAAWARVVCTVATRGKRVPEVLEAALEAGKQHATRVSTATLNLVVREAAAWKRPPPVKGGGGRSGRVYYATQAGTKPPTFVLFVNDPILFPDDYRRYIERALRDSIGFPGTPLRLLWRGKDNGERPPGGGGGRGGGARGGGGGGRGGGGRGRASR